MKGILVTSDDCSPCVQMKEQFKDLIASGEIIEKNFERDTDEVLELINKFEANIPSLLIVTDNGELIVSVKDE